MTFLFLCFCFIADASSAGILGCEIKAAPSSSSRDYQYSNQMTVKPDSNVTLNCSIRNNGTTLGKTWEQVKKTIKPKHGLILKRGNLITPICFTRKLISSLVCRKSSTHKITIALKIDAMVTFPFSLYINKTFFFHTTSHKANNSHK